MVAFEGVGLRTDGFHCGVGDSHEKRLESFESPVVRRNE